MSVTTYSRFVAQRLCDGLSQRYADVFNRVMRVDLQIARRLQLDIDHAMPCDLVDHVI